MPYTRDWDETSPLDHSKFKSQPGYIRSAKTDIAERMSAILYGFTSGETDMSAFKNLNLKAQAGNPTVAASFFNLFVKTVTAKAELFLKTEDAIVRQLTKLGAWIGELGMGAAVASATACDIWAGADGDFIHVTGTTTITSLGTAPHAGACRTVIFDGILTLTHHATNLIIPGGANITTAAGDRMIVRAQTTTTFYIIHYQKADGTAIVAASSATGFVTGDYLMSSAPYALGRTGFLPAIGGAHSRTTFADLYNYAVANGLIGASLPFGVGDGSTTFTVPDWRDRIPVGAKQDDSGVPKTNIDGALKYQAGDTNQPPQTSTYSGLSATGAETSATTSHNHTFVPPVNAATVWIKT